MDHNIKESHSVNDGWHLKPKRFSRLLEQGTQHSI